MILLVNDKRVDLADNSPVALQYELNSTTDLSSFTTTYSSELDLPLTRNNRRIFKFPDSSTVNASFPYRLLNESYELIDEGKLVISEVDGAIKCHLYGMLISLNDELSNYNTLGATLKGNTALNRDGDVVNLVTVPLTASQFSLSPNNDLHLDSSYLGLLNFFKSNIGKPSDFDCSHVYNPTDPENPVDCGERSILSAPSPTPSQSHQYRVYQLTPAIPSLVLFNNLFNASSFDITLSDEAKAILTNVGYVGPSLKSVYSFEPSELRWVRQSSVTSTSTAFKIKDLLSVSSVGLTAVPNTGHYYLVSITNGTATYNVLYYPNQYGFTHDFFESVVTQPFDEAIPFNDRLNEVSIPELSLPINPGTYSITYTTYVVNADETWTTKPVNEVWFYGETGGYTFVPSYYVASPDDLTFSYETYFSSIPKPWEICKSLCKRFNLRLKYVGDNSYVVVPSDRYYGLSFYNLLDFIDASDNQVAPTPFSSHRLRFKDEPVDSLWFDTYGSMFNKTYGQVELITEYPIESTEDWFSSPLKFFVSPNYSFYPWGQQYPSTIEKIGECYDKSGDEIDVSGSLCNLTPVVMSGINLFDNQPLESQCWYPAEAVGHSLVTCPHLVSCNSDGVSLFSYGQALANPDGYRCVQNLDAYFGDVVDSSVSTQITLGVFIDKIHIPIKDFISTLFYFYNQVWVVSKVESYVPGWNEVTRVTFIRVNDLSKYLPTGTATVTASASPSEGGSVSGAGSYTIGSVAHLVATPSSGYEFDHWEDGSTNADRYILVIGDKAVTAYFTSSVTRFLSVQSGGIGTVMCIINGEQHVGDYSGYVREDSTVVVHWSNTGYAVFDHWYESVSGATISQNPYEFTIVADTDLYAESHIEYPFVLNEPISGSASVEIGGVEHVAPYEGTVASGSTVVLRWTPSNESYTFKDWRDSYSGDVYNDNPHIIDSVTHKYNIVAEFDKHYSLTVGSIEHGDVENIKVNGVGVNPPVEVNIGDVITGCDAVPDVGYRLSYLTFNGVRGSLPYTVRGDVVIGAVFEVAVYYDFSVSQVHGSVTSVVGGVTHQGAYSESVPMGTNVSVSFVPDEHFIFDYWNDTVTGEHKEQNPYSFAMYGNHRLVPVSHGEESYTLSLGASQHGTVSNVSVNGVVVSLPCMVYDGDVIDSALSTPDTGYRHVSFTVNGGMVTLPYTIHSNVVFAATYEQIPYTLSLGTIGHGTVSNVKVNGSVVSLPATVHYGDILTSATMTVDEGYNFNSWQINGSDVSLPYTMVGDSVLGARFEIKTYLLSMTQPSHGHISNVTVNGGVVDPPVEVNHFDVLNASCAPDTGYELSSYTINGSDVTLPHTIRTNSTLSARVSQIAYTLSLGSVSHGSIAVKVNGSSVTLPATVHYGDVITATNTPDSGYYFNSYTINGNDVSLPYTITGNAVIGARFSVIDYELSVVQPSHGSISNVTVNGTVVSLPCIVHYGDTLNATVTPDSQYKVNHITVNSNYVTLPYTIVGDSVLSAEIVIAWAGLKFTSSGTSYFAIDSENNRNCEYSVDYGLSWHTAPNLDDEPEPEMIEFSGEIWLRGINRSWGDGSDCNRIVIEGDIANPSGDINSMLIGDSGSATCYAYAFSELFESCNMEDASGIVFGSLSNYRYCYLDMFYGCYNLIVPPVLPNIMDHSCFAYMFAYCTSLQVAPQLPSTTLSDGCYWGMFEGCSSLESAPHLPATTLTSECYRGMFYGCTSLTSAPVLPATTLASSCYYNMFYGCSSLTGPVYINASTVPSTTYTRDMFTNSGTNEGAGGYIYVVDNTSDWNVANAGISTPPWNVTKFNPLRFTSTGNTTIKVNRGSAGTGEWNLKTSTDGSNWSTYTLGTTINLSDGETLYFCGSKDSSTATRVFVMTGEYGASISAWGDCTSILNEVGGVSDLSEYGIRVFESLFEYCSILTSAPLLPSTRLSSQCYWYMFNGCTSLVTAPSLPATSLAAACYRGMFSNCTSLIQAPILPTTSLHSHVNCYAYMFNGCTKLTGPVYVYAATPFHAGEGYYYCKNMFTNTGTARTGTDRNIYVGANVSLWDSTYAGINAAYWDVSLITEDDSDV